MKKALIIVAILLVLLFALIAILLNLHKSFTGASIGGVKEGSVLIVDLSKGFPERAGYDFSGFTFKKKNNFLSLILAIERGAEDEDIKSLVLRPGGSGFGLAQIQELTDALEYFKSFDKRVYVHMNSAGMGEYLLASCADSIFLSPPGEIFFIGMGASQIFFGNAFDKLGIGFDVIQLGDYKGAAEMFTEDGFTPPLRESLTQLVEGLFGNWIEEVSKARGLEYEETIALIDYGLFSSNEALENGLVDGIEYPQEFRDRILAMVDDDENRLVKVNRYISNKDLFSGSDKIAVIYGTGNIHTGESKGSPFGGQESIGSESFSEAIDDAAEDEEIVAIVLRVDSPGGSALASDIIWKSVVEAKESKPVLVSMGSIAASGGYYISMSADSIFCDPSTITGSIGVVFMRPYFEGLMDKAGLTTDTIYRGRLADEFALDRPMSDEGFEALGRMMNLVYEEFTNKAADGRGLGIDSLLELAEGRIWTGTDAVNNGLADREAGLSDVIKVAAKMVGSDPEKMGVVIYPAEKSFFEMAFEMGGMKAKTAIPEPFGSIFEKNLQALEMYSPREILTLMPYVIEFE